VITILGRPGHWHWRVKAFDDIEARLSGAAPRPRPPPAWNMDALFTQAYAAMVWKEEQVRAYVEQVGAI